MRVAVGERLPFADGSFDVVLAQLVVQLMDDREAERMPLLRSFWDAAPEIAPERAAAIDDGRRVGYESPEELGGLFARCGLAYVSTASWS